eukprot:CAMPEP_0174886820 /NCGR_PEP_ID=MMETSP0167-20121228/2064_1 /TAXON_ID=38298 /ORGANISM="Rhodella maculata, Strain CCMP736" /LENGTH=64 /DNA_ID=CAMNT_0016123003 /DNA_START=148 /DNA_END=339 /DNA_ORIENTATION=+
MPRESRLKNSSFAPRFHFSSTRIRRRKGLLMAVSLLKEKPPWKLYPLGGPARPAGWRGAALGVP